MSNQRKTASPSFRPPRAGSGFTMIELLVVMFVIAMLLTIGVPAALKFRTQAKINACRVTVNIVDRAVDMYQKQYKRYPDMAEMAARLIGQSFTDGVENVVKIDASGKPIDPKPGDDFHPGPGFQGQHRGAIHGPWNGVDKLSRSGDYEEGASSARVHFIDAFGAPIWYCPFKDQTYIDSEFDRNDSEDGVSISNIAVYASDASGRFYRRDYIIMSQGANGKWGLIRGHPNETVPTDDVTNFTKE